jgi:glutamate racemase
MKHQPIGVFDSGIGGLTVVRSLQMAMPYEDYVYLGDTARVPYGTKSPDTVRRFACEDALFLAQSGVKVIVVACNTASAWALPTLERGVDIPVFGVILPGARAALDATRGGRIGVIGTSATIRSQSYPRALLARDDTLRVYSRACPLLVPLVEEGWTHHPVTVAVLREYLEPLLRREVDTLILGCTHYPLLRDAVREVVGPGISLVDSADSCAAFVRERLEHLGLRHPDTHRVGTFEAWVTDEVERFAELASRFLGRPAEQARKIELPMLRRLP